MTPKQKLRLYQQVIARLSAEATKIDSTQLSITETNGHLRVDLTIGFDVPKGVTIEEVSSSKNNG